MSNGYERRRGKYSAVPGFDITEYSTSEESELFKEFTSDRRWQSFYKGLVKGGLTAPKIANNIFEMIDTRNKNALLDWNPTQDVIIDVPSGPKSPFASKAGVHRKGFFNTVFGDNMKNSLRTPIQRVKLKDYVIKDDFVNWYANGMTNHSNPEVSSAFKKVIDSWADRATEGKFTMNEVSKWYGSEEYAKLVENGTLPGGEGIYAWMEDVASMGGIKEYIDVRASEWGINPDELHYMMYRDGGYEVIPTMNFSGGKFGDSFDDWSNLDGILADMD